MDSKRSRSPATPTPPGADNFKSISGIGPIVERRLHSAGVLTYAQLAALSPEEIAVLVTDVAGLSAERIAKQNWIGQARELIPVELQQDEDTQVLRRHTATFVVELLLDERSYVLRTQVEHIQSRDKQTWARWEESRLINFFAEHAGLHTESAASAVSDVGKANLVENVDESEMQAGRSHVEDLAVPPLIPPAMEILSPALPSEAGAVATPDALQLEVDPLLVQQVPAEQQGGGPASETRLRAQFNFQLSGAIADQITEDGGPYAIRVLACELPSGQTTVLAADQRQLRPRLLDYATTVEFALPEPGRYQLQGLVLLPRVSKVGVTLGPVVRVIAD